MCFFASVKCILFNSAIRMLPRSFPQAQFDELVASSQSNKDNDDPQDCAKMDMATLKTLQELTLNPLSIDHFLAFYRHEATSIRDFIACLEDSSEGTRSESERVVGSFESDPN